MKCWFCGKEESDPAKVFEIEMYGDVIHAPGDAEEAVSFNKKLISVPRCASCKTRQRTAKNAGGLAVAALVLTAAAVGAGLLNLIRDLYWGLAAGFLFGLVIEFLTIRYYASKGIQLEKRARRKNEEVLKYKTKGYAFGRAPKQHKVKEALYEEE